MTTKESFYATLVIKYSRFALWLVTQKGVVATSLRDIFTAGGRMNIETANNVWENQPQIFYKLAEVKNEIVAEINGANIEWIREFWGHDADAHHDITRIEQWIHLVVDNVTGNTRETKEMLQNIFHQV